MINLYQLRLYFRNVKIGEIRECASFRGFSTKMRVFGKCVKEVCSFDRP